jgi:beta-lactamase class A
VNDGRIIALLEREQATLGGTVGVYVRRVDLPGEALLFNADEVFPAASVIKVPLLAAALALVQEERLDLLARHVVAPADQVPGAGVLHVLEPGLEPTTRDLLTLMIVVSDNTATNMVIDLVGGIEEANRRFEGWGLRSTRLVGKLQLPWGLRNDEQRAGRLNETTPRETGLLLERLWRRELLYDNVSDLALAILQGQQHNDVIPRYLPEGLRILHKTGEIDGVRNDAGLVVDGDRVYVVVLLSKGLSDPREHPDNAGTLALARIAAGIHEAMTDRAD